MSRGHGFVFGLKPCLERPDQAARVQLCMRRSTRGRSSLVLIRDLESCQIVLVDQVLAFGSFIVQINLLPLKQVG